MKIEIKANDLVEENRSLGFHNNRLWYQVAWFTEDPLLNEIEIVAVCYVEDHSWWLVPNEDSQDEKTSIGPFTTRNQAMFYLLVVADFE
jgi:hypothetical protein